MSDDLKLKLFMAAIVVAISGGLWATGCCKNEHIQEIRIVE